MTTQQLDELYAKGGWDGQGSGPGSSPTFTAGYRELLQRHIDQLGWATILDVGCGDWQFMALVQLGGRRYIGLDASRHVVEWDRRRFGSLTTCFLCVDAIVCPWPWADLVLVKDLVHHLEPGEVDALISKTLDYPKVLWTVDVEEDGAVAQCGASAQNFFAGLPQVYEFDRSVEEYRYGRKVTLLYEKTPWMAKGAKA